MKKIILFVLMILPCVVFGDSHKDTPNAKYLSKDMFGGSNKMYPIMGSLMLEVLSNTQHDNEGEFWILGKDTVRNMNEVIDRLVRENIVTSVCNAPFGSSYGETKEILYKQFGNSCKSSNGCIAYVDKTYDGILYNDINFLFQSNDERSYLCRAVFSKDCKSLEEAVKLKKSLDEKLSKRYRLYKILDEDGIYMSAGGISPVPYDGSFAFTVDIIEYSQQIRDAGINCAVHITYGPFDYVK